MSLQDDFEFRKALEYSSNQYGILKSVQHQARELSEKYDNKILHSEAITHVIHDTLPDIGYIYEDEYEARQIRELFCYIDDKAITDAVYDSYYESKSRHKLTFIYNSIADEGMKSRVRVLTRILWYKILKD